MSNPHCSLNRSNEIEICDFNVKFWRPRALSSSASRTNCQLHAKVRLENVRGSGKIVISSFILGQVTHVHGHTRDREGFTTVVM